MSCEAPTLIDDLAVVVEQQESALRGRGLICKMNQLKNGEKVAGQFYYVRLGPKPGHQNKRKEAVK